MKDEDIYAWESHPVPPEEWEYHWALSDISGFVVKYGLERVLKDIQDHIAMRDKDYY